jgi:hypothetical protein
VEIQRTPVVGQDVFYSRMQKDDEAKPPRDQVSLGEREGPVGETKMPPAHLSREMLAQIAKQGLEASGPFTPEQLKYLDQDFAKPGGTFEITRTKQLFGMGGVLLPDSAGRIKHLALQFGNVEFNRPLPAETRNALLNVYKTLFTAMDERTRFTIVAANQEGVDMLKNAVEESGMKSPNRVKIVNGKAEKGFSIWIRDSMIPVSDKGSPKILIQDRTYWPGPEDGKIPPLYAEANDDVTSQVHPGLRIDGGNVLSNQEYIIVGHDSVNHTTDLLKGLAGNQAWKEEIIHFYETSTGKKVAEEGKPAGPDQVSMEEMWNTIAPEVFKSEFQREVFVIGKDNPATPLVEEQPAFHIDMAVTPIGNKKFLVGDPGMAISILETLTPEERARVNEKMCNEASLPQSDIIGKLIEVNGSKAHQANFDNVAHELKERGYEIERMPCFIGLRTTWSLPYLTYNNCIQENYTDEAGKEVKKVYLPMYGCDPLETVAQAIYETNGFKVIPLKMAAVSKLEGAIRCSSHPLERTDVPPPFPKPN